MEAVLAGLPILVVGVLMIGLTWPSSRAMPVGWLMAALLAVTAWDMPLRWLAAAGLVGLINTLDILLIVFGALFILQLMRRSGGVAGLGESMARLSPDPRVQVLLVAWLMGSFLEGAAGFGTPAAVGAPLLVGLGFPPLVAAVVTLMADSTAVTFGAVGVPIWGGFANLADPVSPPPGESFLDYLSRIGAFAGVVHFAIGSFIPLATVTVMTKMTTGSARPGLAVWRLALAGGFALTVPQTLLAVLVGPELPAVLGSLIGLGMFVPLVMAGWGRPREPWRFPDRRHWPAAWEGRIEAGTGDGEGPPPVGAFKAWLPYLLISLLLLAGRLEFLGLTPWLKAWSVGWEGILGTDLGKALTPFYNPGIFPFLFVALLIPLFHGLPVREAHAALWQTLRMLRPAAVALAFTLAMVYTMMHAGAASGRDSMLIVLARAAAAGLGGVWYLAAPMVGALGAFISGSNTVSDIMFGAFQLRTAAAAGLREVPVLALQAVGGAAGNMICVHNVVAVLTTVGLVGKEGLVIRRNLPVAVAYGLLAGAVGWVLVWAGVG